MIIQSRIRKKLVSPLMHLPYSSECKNMFFSLHLHHEIDATFIDMQVFSPVVNTVFLPHTYTILKQLLPAIHTSQCFNEKNLPFAKEVRKTEVGHLFEHILLEYIYEIKTAMGIPDVCITGETSWNWYKFPTGFFSIAINVGSDEKEILNKALIPASRLLEHIYTTHEKHRLGAKSLPYFEENFTPEAMPRVFTVKD